MWRDHILREERFVRGTLNMKTGELQLENYAQFLAIQTYTSETEINSVLM